MPWRMQAELAKAWSCLSRSIDNRCSKPSSWSPRQGKRKRDTCLPVEVTMCKKLRTWRWWEPSEMSHIGAYIPQRSVTDWCYLQSIRDCVMTVLPVTRIHRRKYRYCSEGHVCSSAHNPASVTLPQSVRSMYSIGGLFVANRLSNHAHSGHSTFGQPEKGNNEYLNNNYN